MAVEKKANRVDPLLTPQQQNRNEKEKQSGEELAFFMYTNKKSNWGNDAAPGGRLVQVVSLWKTSRAEEKEEEGWAADEKEQHVWWTFSKKKKSFSSKKNKNKPKLFSLLLNILL